MFTFSKNNTLKLGPLGEKAAAAYLRKNGYKIICTNFTNSSGRRLGEIDIIAKDQAELVFVEVKTRKNPENSIIIPEENITAKKLHKLKKITNYYISINNLWETPFRFDALSLLYNVKNESFNIKHLKNIFL